MGMLVTHQSHCHITSMGASAEPLLTPHDCACSVTRLRMTRVIWAFDLDGLFHNLPAQSWPHAFRAVEAIVSGLGKTVEILTSHIKTYTLQFNHNSVQVMSPPCVYLGQSIPANNTWGHPEDTHATHPTDSGLGVCSSLAFYLTSKHDLSRQGPWTTPKCTFPTNRYSDKKSGLKLCSITYALLPNDVILWHRSGST